MLLQIIRNKIAYHVANVLYFKLPFGEDEQTIRDMIIGCLANKGRPAYYIHWDHVQDGFAPGKRKGKRMQ